MLDLAILGLLEERGDLHGYEIRKQLREGLGLVANVSYGSLYPALARLEKNGAVVATEASVPATPAPAPIPPTGSLSGELAVLRARRTTRRAYARRSRKVYRVTDAGRAMFAALLAEPGAADDARSFGLRLAFARHLPAPARLALLERRRAALKDRLAEARAVHGSRTLDSYASAVAEHMAGGVERDIDWLDHLIDAEQIDAEQAASGHGAPVRS